MCMGGWDWDDLEEQETKKRQGPEAEALVKPSDLPPLLVLLWSTLAPCYLNGAADGVLESDHPEVFLARYSCICEALKQTESHIICLPEYWFDTRLSGQFAAQLEAAGFELEVLQHRPRSRDGVAVLWRTDSVRLSLRSELRAHGSPSDNVALLMVLRDARVGGEYGPRLAVLCTHLAPDGYRPGCGEQAAARLQELLRGLTRDLAHIASVPTLVCATLGEPASQEVSDVARSFGFRSVWEAVHEEPCRKTHTNQLGQSFVADHMWVRGLLDPKTVALLPSNTPDDAEPLRPQLQLESTTVFTSNPTTFDDWGTLSDHRPLLAGFTWPS